MNFVHMKYIDSVLGACEGTSNSQHQHHTCSSTTNKQNAFAVN